MTDEQQDPPAFPPAPADENTPPEAVSVPETIDDQIKYDGGPIPRRSRI